MGYVICTYFLQDSGLHFNSLNSVFWIAEVLYFNELPFYQLILLWIVLLVFENSA